jgi:pimeloyl-ACP methyl ester carboxylesterase
MATELELGLLAYRVYGQGGKNEINMPSWPEDLTLHRDFSSRVFSSGFGGSVYTNGSEVVISFRGTDFDTKLEKFQDFWNGNIPAARGSYSDQVIDAIELVADTIAKYGKNNITFTGHSLGAGLASLMAVFFDLPAVTFDPAPFALTARGEVIPVISDVIPLPIPVAVRSMVLSQYAQNYLYYQSDRGRAVEIRTTGTGVNT